MVRRQRRSSLRFVASFLSLLALFACVRSAQAQDPPRRLSGAIDARFLAGISNRHGGLLGVELWAGTRTLRLGGTFGVGAISKRGKISSRVYTPVGLSLGLLPRADKSGPTAVLRLGAYAGAEKEGLMVGPFASCALGYRSALGEGASVRFGLDAWALFMNEGSLFLGPYLGLGF